MLRDKIKRDGSAGIVVLTQEDLSKFSVMSYREVRTELLGLMEEFLPFILLYEKQDKFGSFGDLMALDMISEGNYNIYRAASLSAKPITPEYLHTLTERSPSVTEVSEYISEGLVELSKSKDAGDAASITAHALLSDLGLLNLPRMVKEQSEVIQSLTGEISVLKEKNAVVSAVGPGDSGGRLTSESIKKLNTTVAGCKARSVLYFKEIRQIPFINSFILEYASYLRNTRAGKKVRVLIFDSQELIARYKPLNCLDVAGYLKNRELYSATEMLVLTEPNTVALQDAMSGENHADYLIIYDRMGLATDFVEGSVVSKFPVIGTMTELKNFRELFQGVPNQNYILPDEGMQDKAIVLPFIDDYEEKTAAARSHAWARSTVGNALLFQQVDIIGRVV